MNCESETFLALLRSDEVVRSRDAELTPLSGGVSSEIYRVDDCGEQFVVKRALPKLKVLDDWPADVSRNVHEHRFIAYLGRHLPRSVPALRAVKPQHGYFAMEYLGSEFHNWKQLLLDGHFDPAHVRTAACILGQLHRVSSGDPEALALFDGRSAFYQLRLDPYLLTTGQRHPHLRPQFEDEAKRLQNTAECLVHGDFSPKNILIRSDRMVILDCEAACYGDPAFDVAFLLTHLFLKTLVHRSGEGLAGMIHTFWQEYALASGYRLEDRVPRLLLMLLLARIDGKSPVEYLRSEPQKAFVRRFVYSQLSRGAALSLDELSRSWFESPVSLKEE